MHYPLIFSLWAQLTIIRCAIFNYNSGMRHVVDQECPGMLYLDVCSTWLINSWMKKKYPSESNDATHYTIVRNWSIWRWRALELWCPQYVENTTQILFSEMLKWFDVRVCWMNGLADGAVSNILLRMHDNFYNYRLACICISICINLCIVYFMWRMAAVVVVVVW